jgi:hypothetical protein
MIRNHAAIQKAKIRVTNTTPRDLDDHLSGTGSRIELDPF